MSTTTNTIPTLVQRFADTVKQADGVDLTRARVAYAATASVNDGGLGFSVREFADAVSSASGRGFTSSTINRLAQAWRLSLNAGIVPTRETVGLALSFLNNGRKTGDTLKTLADAVVALPADERVAALTAGLSDLLAGLRQAAADKRAAVAEAVANSATAEMIAPSPADDPRAASDRGVRPSLDDLLAAVKDLTGRIASGEVAYAGEVADALGTLDDAVMAATRAVVAA